MHLHITLPLFPVREKLVSLSIITTFIKSLLHHICLLSVCRFFFFVFCCYFVLAHFHSRNVLLYRCNNNNKWNFASSFAATNGKNISFPFIRSMCLCVGRVRVFAFMLVHVFCLAKITLNLLLCISCSAEVNKMMFNWIAQLKQEQTF